MDFNDTLYQYIDTFSKGFKTANTSAVNRLCPLERGSLKRKHGEMTETSNIGVMDYCPVGTPGLVQLGTITALLDRLGKHKYVRTSVQKDIHNGMIAAVLPKLFVNDSDSDMRKAMRLYNMTQTKQQFMVLAGRRVGKTIATAMFTAAYLLSVPSCSICVFSTGRRASNLFLQEVKSLLLEEPVFASLISTDNSEHLRLNIEGDLRKISSFPGNARTLRGVGGDLLILEEAAHIKSDVFYEVIVPLMGLKTTSVLAISTPGTSDNWYSTLLEKVDSRGDLIFSCYTAHNTCLKCKLNRRAATCKHIAAEIAPWKSKAKKDVTQAMYSDNKALAMRELSGIVADDVNCAYNRLLVSHLFKKQRIPVGTGVQQPPVIFIAIDPCGGGASQFAIASIFLKTTKQSNNLNSDRYEFVLCGSENKHAQNHEDVKRIVLSHVKGLRCVYPNSHFCIGIESNLGMEASNISHMLVNEPNIFCLEETKKKDGTYGSGFTTTYARKIQYYELLHMALSRDIIYITNEYVSEDASESLKVLEQQMLAYKRILSKPTNAFSKEKQTFSGKVDGTGRMAPDRLCDDLLLAVQMALFIALLVADDKAVSCPRSAFSKLSIQH